MPRLWRMALVALCTLILCSCRGPGRMVSSPAAPASLPPSAFGATVDQACPEAAPAAMTPEACPAPSSCGPTGPWRPPGIAGPWPQDEYLIDGGDRSVQVAVNTDWQVRGLEPEDTIAHFDTLDGRTLVEPSNRVCLYAPRFGAVRKVVSLVQEEQTDRVGDVRLPTKLVRCDEVEQAATSKQQIQPGRNRGARPPIVYRGKQGDGAISAACGLSSFQDAFQPYENLKLVRDGSLNARESAGLARGVAAAIVWSSNEGVQVILDNQAAAEDVSVVRPQKIYTIDQPPAHPKLQVVKLASTPFAEPGDTVDFTIRFDNVGNQPIGNVTLLDSLTTRLDYVPDSAQSSLKATFRAEPNEADSQVLRWEIQDPLPPGKGGILRFRCRIR